MAVKRVLIVDDTMSIGRLVEATLNTIGADLSISVVPSAEEALLESGLYKVDLIVTDYLLPGISGLELASRAQKRSPDTKVILMSGIDDSTLSSQAIEAGAEAFFAKPLDLEKFTETARAMLALDEAPSAGEQADAPAAVKEPVIEELSKPEVSLSDILGDLRDRLGASGALLVGGDGRIVAQAGSRPDPAFESAWVSPLMTLVGNSYRVSTLVGGTSATTVMVFRGETMDLLLAPVGAFGLVITLDSGDNREMRTALAFEEAMHAQQKLGVILEDMGIRVQKARETSSLSVPEGFVEPKSTVEEPAEPVLTGDLEALFKSESKVSGDADAFWDELSTSSDGPVINPDALSFEEAQKLGLAPEDFE